MNETLQQLALLDALVSNWQRIWLLVISSDPASEAELGRLGERLREAASPSEIAVVVDDLLDLVEDTAATELVRELLDRSDLSRRRQPLERGGDLPQLFDLSEPVADPRRIADSATAAGRELGDALGAPAAETVVEPVPVFFATNRAGETPKPGTDADPTYTGEFSASTRHGLAQVSIPVAAHRIGRVERPRWWQRFASKDPDRFMLVGKVASLEGDEFASQLSAALADEDGGDLLVFLHGFNVDFEEAVMRAAQISYDLRFKGAVVLFSWPSLGSVLLYDADEARADASGEALAGFLATLAGGPWRRVHLVAHSMGNRVLLSGLADNPATSVALGQVVLVAADVYVEAFRNKFPKMMGKGLLKTSYVSTQDRALLLSRWLHRGARIGFAEGPPFVTNGMETVDASHVNTSLLGLGLGHGYLAKRSVLTDLGYLIREGLPAAQRGLEAVGRYYRFPR